MKIDQRKSHIKFKLLYIYYVAHQRKSPIFGALFYAGSSSLISFFS
ncbi:hypothetical protein H311_02058 [Anncaliia algerae PRA109]|nr:hypothetical protein H311_02058 [Anncaliia algerae PRA109]